MCSWRPVASRPNTSSPRACSRRLPCSVAPAAPARGPLLLFLRHRRRCRSNSISRNPKCSTAGGGMRMSTAPTPAPGLGGPMALVVVQVVEMTTAVAATMGEGRGSMGITGGVIRIRGGTGRRRGEGRLRMAGDMKRMRMKMGFLGSGGSTEAVGGMMR
uniref:Uncharacterized protein n=1 Tax=Arundo donax TaxID=35708 RepID=A0A0A9BL57_ARUDO